MKKPLPEKLCPVCQRPFSWRKRWERCWDSVVYCSDACRRGTPRGGVAAVSAANIPARGAGGRPAQTTGPARRGGRS
ncbi:MAG: DUF2256 domain-containing protein [Lysobacterales bacterium]|jgi:hypothetical protein